VCDRTEKDVEAGERGGDGRQRGLLVLFSIYCCDFFLFAWGNEWLQVLFSCWGSGCEQEEAVLCQMTYVQNEHAETVAFLFFLADAHSTQTRFILMVLPIVSFFFSLFLSFFLEEKHSTNTILWGGRIRMGQGYIFYEKKGNDIFFTQTGFFLHLCASGNISL